MSAGRFPTVHGGRDRRPRKLRHLALVAAMLFAPAAAGQDRAIAPADLRSGITFAGPDVRAMQQDDFANPAMLWVVRGERLWKTPAGPDGKSCAGCHQDARQTMQGVATRYPKHDSGLGRVVNLEGRIAACRETRQGTAPLQPESDDSVALLAWVAHQSRGMPIDVAIDGPARPHFDRGRALYHRRVGQLDLSCAQCHESNWGRRLLAETISQGHGNAYPIYRLEWQAAGTLHRRFRSCLNGVRAEMLPYGSSEYLDLELFLAWRAKGLAIETPGVRR
jgi:sulfur-oxidizing protein SoxA